MKAGNDAQLINDILSGDDSAFNTLVRKYQKSIHALVWRKIGDFHYAEEVTQDTFLRAYKNLATLKEPSQFAGWLYVIANRLCINWRQRNKSAMQSLEDISMGEIEKSSYTSYISEQREAKATEDRHELVKNLLATLPESERTVITLYYLGEMTTKEIGKFLGVSVNTITSRLQRARKRLQEDQELLIQEVLSGAHISPSLTDNIMQQVADIKPTPTSSSKPSLPWVAFGTAVALITLLLGTSHQYLARFQKPYSFEAKSQPTIEIIDAPATLTIDAKPAVRSQAGRAAIPNENTGGGLQTSENTLAQNTQMNPFRPTTSQWKQARGPQGSHVSEIFVTSTGHFYTITATGIYMLTADAAAWIPINTSMPTGNVPMPMAEHDDTLYIVSGDKLFASVDGGETWKGLGNRPRGYPIDLIITEALQNTNSQDEIVMYLALREQGVFRFKDTTRQWDPLNDGLVGKSIYAVAAVQDTVFAGTDKGLYRLNADVWERLPLDASNAVHSLAVSENNLYVATGPNPLEWGLSKTDGKYVTQRITGEAVSPWKIFHSTDLGSSWTEITPKDKPSVMVGPRSVKILSAGKTLLVLDGGLSFRSTDDGHTWDNLGFDRNPIKQNILTTAGVDENTFYITGAFGVYRTVDSGHSWHPCMEGMIGTRIRSLTAFNNRLYAYTGSNVVQSIDGGESWKTVRIDTSKNKLEAIEQENSRIDFSFTAKLALADGGLYGIVPDLDNLHIFRLSTDGNTFIRIQGIPNFDREMLSTELWTAIAKAERLDLPNDIEKNAKLMEALRSIATFVAAGGFAVSDEIYYVEHQRSLFKWKASDSQWIHTGLTDLGEQPNEEIQNGFKLAASGETIYVGKQTGQLFQSLDGGNTWRDITLILPIRFIHFNRIRFVGSAIYIATDKGVLTSQNGESWRVLADGTGTHIVVDRLAINGMRIYGAGDTGIYHLDTQGKWQQISPNVPDKVISLAINNNKLYIATQHRGIFHISLGEASYNTLSEK